jgi:hypothetical protein
MARFRRGAVGLGLVITGVLVMTGPAWSDEETVDERGAYIKKTCERIKRPPTGGLEKTTDPAPGSRVHSGDVIKIRLTWDTDKWAGSKLHKAIDCVAVNGALDMNLTVEEKPTANDGVFEHELTVPDGLAAGTEICDRGFISGDSRGGDFEQATSEVVCFPLGPPPTARETSTTTTTTLLTSPTTVTTVPQVLGEQEAARPKPGPALVQAGPPAAAPAPAPAPAPPPALPAAGAAAPPRTIATTGAFAYRTLMGASGLALWLGGLSLMGGAGRSRRATGGRRG